MKSDIDPELEKLVLRATKFLYENVQLDRRSVNALADVVECYIRAAHVHGQVSGLEQSK